MYTVGGTDQIYVGTAAGHLTEIQLLNIQFSGNAVPGAEQLATGEIVPASEAPEDPDISAAPALLNFGTLNPFATSNLSVVVSNAGPGILSVTDLTFSGSNTFSVLGSATPFNVAAGAVSNLTVQYNPGGSSGTHTGTLHIASNDPDTSPTNIILQAQAVLPPGLFNGSFDHDLGSLTPDTSSPYWGQSFPDLAGWTENLTSGVPSLANGTAAPPYAIGNGSTVPYRYPTDGGTFLAINNCNYNLTQVISGMSIGRVKVSFDLIRLDVQNTVSTTTARIELFDGNSDAAPLLYDSGTINIHGLAQETWTSHASDDLENTSSVLFIRVTLFDNTPAAQGGIDNIVVSQVPLPDISASPSLLNFGTMESGAISNLSVVVSNAGPGTLSITDFTFSGSNTFSVVDSTPINVVSGATTTLTVKYQPAGDIATHTGTLHIASTDMDTNPTNIILQGVSIAGNPDISAAPSLLSFGTINPFATSNLSVVVSNAGPGVLSVTDLTFSGSNTFSVLGSTTPFSVAVGAVSNLTVQYNPGGSSGTHTGTLHIASNDPDTNPTNIILQAQAALPPGLFNGSFDYDADAIVGLDGQQWGQTFTSLSGWTYSGSGNMRLANGDAAGPPYYTGNGGTMPYRYPTDGETYLSLGDCDYNLRQVISGMNIGRVNVSFDLLNMQHNPVNAAIRARVELFDGNSDAAPLLYDSGTINIHNLPEETWTPYASGDIENTSTVLFIRVTLFENADAAAGGIDNIVVSQVPLPDISASPSLLDFGTIESGAISNLSVVVSNAGPGTLSITNFTFSGSNTFSILESTPINVVSGATTTLTVKYQPAGDIATHTGTLHIASTDMDTNPTNIILQGVSIAGNPDISAAPSLLSFGTINPFATSNLSVVVSNAGPGVLSVTDLTFSGSNTFSVLGSTTPFSVAVGAVSNLTVQYNPAGSSGTHTGTLHIASNDPDTSPTNITLQGQAVLPPGLFNGSFDYDADAINGIAGQAWGQVFTSLSGWTYSGSGNLRLANGDAAGPPYYTGNGTTMPFRYPTDGETYLSLGDCNYNLTQVVSGMNAGRGRVSFDLLNMQHNPVHAAIRARIELFDGPSDAAPLLYDSGTINIHSLPQETWTRYTSGELDNTSSDLFIRVTLFENATAAAGGIDNIALVAFSPPTVFIFK